MAPANVILISAAEDSYALMDYVTEELRNKIGSTTKYKYTADRYFKYDEIQNAINSGNLFEDTAYIEINYKTKPPVEQQKELISLIKKIDKNIFLIVTTDKLTNADQNSAWVKAFNNGGWFINITQLDASAIIRYRLTEQNLTISNNALDMLLQLNQGNMGQLMQEINKLIFLFPPQSEISLEQIKEHSIDNSVYNMYQLGNAYLAGKLAQSIAILDNIYQKPEDAILLQWLISEDTKKLIRIKAKLRHNNNFSQIAQEIKIWGSNANLYQAAQRRLGYSVLLDTLDKLANLDMIIKGLVNKDAKLQLTQIISNLCSNNDHL